MTTCARTGSAAGAVCAVTMGLAAQAHAIPEPVGSAQEIVYRLEADGYKVVVNNATASLDQCVVTAIRPGPPVAETLTEAVGKAETPTRTTVYVDVRC